VAGLPAGVKFAHFNGCTGLTSVAGLPDSVEAAYFHGCSRLRRFKRSDARYRFDYAFDPARDVHAIMVSGVSNLLLNVGIGPDAALLIAQFATGGLGGHSPPGGHIPPNHPADRMETMQQVRARYGLGS